MTREIIIAGFGGQGVMSMGKTLVEAGMEEGLDEEIEPAAAAVAAAPAGSTANFISRNSSPIASRN